jgi:hypothetical protein
MKAISARPALAGISAPWAGGRPRRRRACTPWPIRGGSPRARLRQAPRSGRGGQRPVAQPAPQAATRYRAAGARPTSCRRERPPPAFSRRARPATPRRPQAFLPVLEQLSKVRVSATRADSRAGDKVLYTQGSMVRTRYRGMPELNIVRGMFAILRFGQSGGEEGL